MTIKTKQEAKALTTALRRELKALEKPTQALTHNDCLAVISKALGFASWNALAATLEDEKARPPQSAVIEASAPRYPLTNEGQFDFIAEGELGVPFGPGFEILEGTAERVLGTAAVCVVSRGEGDHLDIDYAGETHVDWDSQESLTDKRDVVCWVDDSWNMYPQTRLVILPDEYHGNPFSDEDLPIRDKLVAAFASYFEEYGSAAKEAATPEMREKVLNQAEAVVGFDLTKRERQQIAAHVWGMSH